MCSFASRRRRMASHAHLGTTGRETSWAREVWGPRRHRGPRAGGCGQEELRDSSCDSERTGAESAQRTYISRHRRAGVAGLAATGGTGPARGPWSRRGLRASRRSCSTRSGRPPGATGLNVVLFELRVLALPCSRPVSDVPEDWRQSCGGSMQTPLK
jgi:hypothetical protein